MTDITNCDPLKLFKKAYELSAPGGISGDLPDHIAQHLAKELGSAKFVYTLDTVLGRKVRLYIDKSPDGKLSISENIWYEHSQEQLDELLSYIGALK